MRNDLSIDRFGWLHRLDYKTLIIAAFLFRLILASCYDIFVTVTDRDPLLPDSKSYSARGRYVSLLLKGCDKESLIKDFAIRDARTQYIFSIIFKEEKGALPQHLDETTFFLYIIGSIYFAFGYFTIWIRIFNIVLSIASVYLLFRVAERRFGDITARLFLPIALFLPTQVIYSITLTKDFLRVFAVSLLLWLIYGLKR